jgi:adenylyltransferase/sulfurtransferase
LDVRTTEEFERQHLPIAVNVPLRELEHYKIDEEKTTYLICETGMRSETAARMLQEKYPNKQFVNVLGGMKKMMTLCP